MEQEEGNGRRESHWDQQILPNTFPAYETAEEL